MTDPLFISHVSKHFGAHHVLDDVTFSLKEGEIFGLIGLNGVGKTTLIKMILNLIDMGSGDITLYGKPSIDAMARKTLSYLPEKFQPSRYLKGREYLALCASYYGRTLDMEKASQMAAALDLAPEKLLNKVGSYSKGMGQKLGLIGAFLVDTPLLILDEPMSGLDPRARIMLKNQMLKLKEEGKTLFFSSHILSDIDEICDRIGVISDRKLIFLGTPSDFKAKFPQDSLEKSFLQAIAA